MKIELLDIGEIKPYEKNAKLHPEWQIDQIVTSIREFGNNDPIAIDENNVIIEGHGRYEALKKIGVTQIPIIRLTHLNGQQKKAYILAHNKLTMNTDYDEDVLKDELEAITDIDMSLFDFEPVYDTFEDELEENERSRTTDAYNMSDFDRERTSGFWQIPTLKPVNFIPSDLKGFNTVLTAKDHKCGIHFYIDDYQFERIWNDPYLYIDKLKDFQCCLTPNFSMYMSMPRSMKLWNYYRNMLIGQIMQDAGIKVIPAVLWAERETFDFCFDGMPQNSTIAVSTVGVKRNKESTEIWNEGMRETILRLEPKTILLYGGMMDFDFGNIKIIEYKNHITENMKNGAK